MLKILLGFMVTAALILGSVTMAMSQITISNFRTSGFSTGVSLSNAKAEPCLAIGAACAAAMEGIARQPEAETKIRGALLEHAERIKALNLRCERHHVAEAMGLFVAEQASALARQPEAEGKLKDLAELCTDLLRDQL